MCAVVKDRYSRCIISVGVHLSRKLLMIRRTQLCLIRQRPCRAALLQTVWKQGSRRNSSDTADSGCPTACISSRSKTALFHCVYRNQNRPPGMDTTEIDSVLGACINGMSYYKYKSL